MRLRESNIHTSIIKNQKGGYNKPFSRHSLESRINLLDQEIIGSTLNF